MAKKIIKKLRIEKIKGGVANPSPPIGPILGGSGVNIMDFCKQFNARTQDKQGQVCPVVVTVYEDKSFEFIVRNPPVSVQLFEATKLKKGSKESNRTKVAKVDWDQIKTIVENKMSDLNCFTLESAMSMVAGTARSMGIEVSGPPPVYS
ncbi:MAG: 50S ribosomal protein L11 [Flavobacteriales bacterium AspAUS03]